MKRSLRDVRTGLFGLGAVVLLSAGLAGCQQRAMIDTGGFGGGVVRLGDTEVARVDGTPIYLSDVERAAASQGLIAPGTPLSLDAPVFRTTLEELVDQRLLALDALRRGVDQQDEARRRLLAARERILGNLNVEQALSAAVTDQSIRELYDAQSALAARGPERNLRQIVVADEITAQEVVERLEDGEDFAELAEEYSTDTLSKARGGRVGWVGRNSLPAALRRPVFEARVGGRTQAIATPTGWHVVAIIEERTPEGRTFEDVREELARFMTYQTIEAQLSDLRETAEISYGFGAAVAGQVSSEQASQSGDPQ